MNNYFQDSLDQYQTSLKLFKINSTQYKFIKNQIAIYIKNNEIFEKINTNKIDEAYLTNLTNQLFIDSKDYPIYIEMIQSGIRKLSGSLSMGKTVLKINALLSLLQYNLCNLYHHPTSSAIKVQERALINLLGFFKKNPSYIKHSYHYINSSEESYIFKQPFLSSFLVYYFLLSKKWVGLEEADIYFLVSYFKDIGQSLIPQKYFLINNQGPISPDIKSIIDKHPEYSVKILRGKVDFSEQNFNIIANHHKILANYNELTIFGPESILISIMDNFNARINSRPYRNSFTIYEGLKDLLPLVDKQFSYELKQIILFCKNFFS